MFQLLHEAWIDLLNIRCSAESTDTSDVKLHLLIFLYAGYKDDKVIDYIDIE